MKKRDRLADGDVTLLKGMAIEIVVGPVVTRKGAMPLTAGHRRRASAAGTLTAGSKMPIMRATPK